MSSIFNTTTRRRTFELLAIAEEGDLRSTLIDRLLMLLIVTNIIALMVSTVDSIYRRYGVYFDLFELFSVAVFTIEYIARVWSCVEDPSKRFFSKNGRWRYVFTPLALIDLFAILPFYLNILIGVDLRFLRVIRTLGLFKLTRYSASMDMLIVVFRREAPSFAAATFILAIVLVLASSGIYLFEKDVQPEHYSSIPASIWWAVATLTTVGYGDVYPITLGGRLFGMLVMVIGIGLVALPAGILSSAFTDELRRRHERFDAEVKRALSDGVIDENERDSLEKLSSQLGLGAIEPHMLNRNSGHPQQCPHCGKFSISQTPEANKRE